MRAAILLLLVAAVRTDAQVIETPVPFDSGARVRSLTPALVARFELRPPEWPVAGDFVAARLYSVSSGGTVLSVERASGQVERYALADDQISALRGAVDRALLADTTAVVGERPSETAVAARRAFARNQMILSAIVYGPLIASFADDGRTATALYLLSVGASFFAVNDMAKNTNVTHTQNDLATDGTIRGYAATSGLVYAFSGDGLDRKIYSALGLAGAIGGAKLGFERGRRLTDSEAQAARKASTLSAATTLGVLGAMGMFEEPDQDRPVIGAVVAGGLAGYLVGPEYPRRARYTVTGGDVRLLPVGALVGAAAGLTPVLTTGEVPMRWGLATVGGIAGTLLMDRTLVRKYDYTNADATQLWFGTLAGALLGGAVVALTEPASEEVVLGMLTAGAFFGTIGGHNLARPASAAPRGASNGTVDRPTRRGARLHFDPTSLALAASRVPGTHALVRLSF